MMQSRKLVVVVLLAWLTVVGLAQAEGVPEFIKLQAQSAKAKAALGDAIGTARGSVPFCVFLKAELTMQGSAIVYRVEQAVGQEITAFTISATDGREVSREPLRVTREARDLDALAKATGAVRITPQQALEHVAKAADGGRIVAIEFAQEKGEPLYLVRWLGDLKLGRGVVSAVTGDVRDVELTGVKYLISEWRFDEAPVGKVPEGWSIRQTQPAKQLATWEVAADAKAATPPNVLALTRTVNEGRAFNLAVADDSWYTDVDLTVSVKAVSGKEDQGGGPIWRCQDENNYYICRFNPLEANFRVYKVVAGERKQLESVKIETEAGRWYTVGVRMVGNQIECLLDGEKLLSATDDTFAGPGMVGLWTKADAVTSFDNLKVRVPRGKP
ncbi:MAG: hypothetical protein PVJ57_15035 [Phycisphaerae bacterium]